IDVDVELVAAHLIDHDHDTPRIVAAVANLGVFLPPAAVHNLFPKVSRLRPGKWDEPKHGTDGRICPNPRDVTPLGLAAESAGADRGGAEEQQPREARCLSLHRRSFQEAGPKPPVPCPPSLEEAPPGQALSSFF